MSGEVASKDEAHPVPKDDWPVRVTITDLGQVVEAAVLLTMSTI